MKDRVMVTFSLPFHKKKEIEQLIISNSFRTGQKQTLSNFCLNAVLLYTKIQKVKEFGDLKEVWGEIFINNNNLTLQEKFEILKEFKKEIEEEIEELKRYFNYKKIKNLENDESVKKVENFGEMASWIVVKIKNKDKKNEED